MPFSLPPSGPAIRPPMTAPRIIQNANQIAATMATRRPTENLLARSNAQGEARVPTAELRQPSCPRIVHPVIYEARHQPRPQEDGAHRNNEPHHHPRARNLKNVPDRIADANPTGEPKQADESNP